MAKVTLTAQLVGNDDIAALNIAPYPDRLEAVIDRTDAAAFMADCQGWDADRFEQGFGIVVTMSAEKWAEWLDLYASVEENEAYNAGYLASHQSYALEKSHTYASTSHCC